MESIESKNWKNNLVVDYEFEGFIIETNINETK